MSSSFSKYAVPAAALGGILAVTLATIQRRRKIPSIKFDDESEYHMHVSQERSDEVVVLLNGRTRNTIKWLPSKGHIRAVLVISHGLHEHALRYCDLAHTLTAKGFAVFAIDHEGHGHSGNVRGLISDWHHLAEDFASFVGHVHSQFPSLPIFMLGHSMGCSVIINAIVNPGKPDIDLSFVKGAVFCGNAFVPGPGALCPWGFDFLFPYRKAVVPLVFLLAKVFPQAPASYLSYEEMVKDEEALAHLHHDPRRYHGYMMNRTATEIIKMLGYTREKSVTQFSLPFLALHGADDKVAFPSGSEMLFEKAATSKDKKRLELLPGMKHEFLHEGKIEGPKNIAKVAAYLEEQLALVTAVHSKA